MISARDVILGLFSAWRLFLFDRNADRYIDSTVGGFWKSFYAAVIVLPGVIILHLLVVRNNPELFAGAGMARLATVFAIEYVYQWVLFPLAMIYIADAMGREHRYVSYIVARNWSHVIQITIVLPAAVIFFAGDGDGTGLGSFLLIAAYLVIGVYTWFIARTVLDITGLAAVVIVAIELAITEAISFVGKVLIAGGGSV